MAGAGFKDFTAGDVLTADQVDTYLMHQSVMVFASASARDTALSGVLAEGMHCYLSDTDTRAYYNGSAWIASTPWTQYTPVISTWSLGNATHSCWYRVEGDVVHLSDWILLGTGSTMVGTPQWDLPVDHGETSGLLRFPGEASIGATSSFYPLYWRTQTTTQTFFRKLAKGSYSQTVGLAVNASGTYAETAVISATIPITFATGHYITRRGTYRI